MGKTYYIRKVRVGGGSSRTLKKKRNKCWSLFHIPPPPCQNHKKPVPFDCQYVSISGFLTDVMYKPYSELDIVEHFTVSIDHIAFLGQQSTIPNTLDSKYYLPAQFSGLIDFPLAPVKTLHRGKSLIDYKHGRPMPITTTTVPPTTPATPSSPQGPLQKRQRIEADQSSDSNSSDIYVPEK